MPLRGRGGECAAIDEVLANARKGRSGVLLVRGAPRGCATGLDSRTALRQAHTHHFPAHARAYAREGGRGEGERTPCACGSGAKSGRYAPFPPLVTTCRTFQQVSAQAPRGAVLLGHAFGHAECPRVFDEVAHLVRVDGGEADVHPVEAEVGLAR
jgi:hypothetical protein